MPSLSHVDTCVMLLLSVDDVEYMCWGVLVADEEDEAIPNEGSLIPFLALLMIYEFFSLHPPCQHMRREDAKRRPRPPNYVLDIVCNLCVHMFSCCIDSCICERLEK